MMREIVRAAAVQLSPVLFSREGTTEKVCARHRGGGGARRAARRLSGDGRAVLPVFLVHPAAGGDGQAAPRALRASGDVPGPTTDAVSRGGAPPRVSWSRWASTSAITARSTTRSSSSTPTVRSCSARRKITPDVSRAHDLGPGPRRRPPRRRHRRRARRAARVLGALQPARALRAHGRTTKRSTSAMFPGSMVGQIFADQIEVTIRHHALESGLLRGQRHGLAHAGAARAARAGHGARVGARRRLLHGDRLARGRAPRAAAHRRRRAWSSPISTSRSSPRASA